MPIFRGSDGRGRLRLSVEQSLIGETLAKLIEGQLQRPDAVRIEVLADELVLTLRFVHAQTSTRDHVLTISRTKPLMAERRPEHDGLELSTSRPSG